ncbi:WD domain, G-beta repeat protein [Dictyocaulus viviparus]|uniref:WD domain, G-beta repeat protein n=1 Tax=Dictyocaulus viviparus TaxID=29172 RepID=A0A0D8X9B3_DICVI|nr:WD domain, G-beta repeat protein [Dictyocaulus viviparus]
MSQTLRENGNKTPVGSMRDVFPKNPTSTSKKFSSNQSIFGLNGASKNQKGLRRRDVTPSRAFGGVNVCSGLGGDRYIAIKKSEQDLEFANYLMSQPSDSTFNTSNSAPSSPAKNYEQEQMKRMMRVKSAGNLTDACEEDRILCYKKNMAPIPAVGHLNQAKVLYSTCIQPSSTTKKSNRHIPQHPERVLDAPDFKDDYYMNVIDWSSCGVVAVALSCTLYLWNADSGEIQVLFELDESNEMNLITSVKWSLDGKFLAVGFKDGSLKLYDPQRVCPPNGRLELRTMKPSRQSRNGVLAWRGAVVSAGYQSGQIIHHDVRISQHVTGVWDGHQREVVGLHWSYNQTKLASGSGDNTVRLWDESRLGNSISESLYVLDEHVGSVRAVQFCNYKSSLLASGGGMQCKSIKLWNVNSGELLKSIQTGAAVNGIIFNSDYKEMMSAHACGKLVIWKHPTYAEIAKLPGKDKY